MKFPFFRYRRDLARVIGVVLSMVLCSAVPSWADNSVAVESQLVSAGQAGVSIAIRISNDVEIRSAVVPLVIREITPGAFISSLQVLPLGERFLIGGPYSAVFAQYADPDGACKDDFSGGFATPSFSDNASHPVAASPEGALIAFTSIGASLLPGSDVNGSLGLVVDIAGSTGSFEIDTTCVDPSNHLLFADNAANPIVPVFTKGIVTVSDESGGEMYATGANGTELIKVDLTSGVGTPIGPIGYEETFAAAFTSDGTLWTIVNGFGTNGPAQLATIDLETGTATPVGIPFTATETVISLVASSSTLYASGWDGGFYSVDRQSGQLTLIGVMDLRDVMDLAFDKDGNLWAIGGSESRELHTIDPTSGESVFHLNISSSANMPMGLAIVANNEFFIMDYADGAFLHRLDPSTGAVNPVGVGIGVSFPHGGDVAVGCNCPFQCDYDADGFLTALDLGALIDVLFAGRPEEQEPGCPNSRGDFDCDGFPTALDLGQLIDHLFAGGDPPCDPCAP